MPLHSDGAESVSCAEPNSVVYGQKMGTDIANFQENFKTEKNGFKGFRKLPAVVVQRCDVAAPDLNPDLNSKNSCKPNKCANLTRKNLALPEKIPKTAQNENFVCNNSVQPETICKPSRSEIFTGKDSVNVEKIAKCSVSVVKDDLEKLRASLSKASRGCNCGNIANDKNISRKTDLPDLATEKSDVVYKNLDTSALHKDKDDTENVISAPVVLNKSKSRKLVTKPVHNRNNSPTLDIPTVHSFYYYKRKYRRWDIPIVLNGLKNLNLSSSPAVHSDVDTYKNLVTTEREYADVSEKNNTPVPNVVNIPQNLDVRVENPDIPAVHNDVNAAESLDVPEQSCTNVSENVITSEPNQTNTCQSSNNNAVPNLNIDTSLNTPLEYNGVKIMLNDKLTVKPNFNVSVVLVKADLKKLKKALSRRKRRKERKNLIRAELKRLKEKLLKERQKRKRKHSKCIHRIKANTDHHTFQYYDTPIIDTNGNISHFDNAIDSGISISPNSEASILESDINISPEYSSGINTGMNTSKHSYTPIVDSERTSKYDEDIFQDSYIPMLNAYVNSCVNISKDCETSCGNSVIFPSISLDSVTPITDSDLNNSLNSDTQTFIPDLNICPSSNDTAIVGSDVNLSPYSDSSSYVESDINISQYSHTPIVDSDIIQYADTSMLESDINFAQDAEGLMEAVMSIAQYAASSTPDSNLMFPRDYDVPIEQTNTYRQEEPQPADVSEDINPNIVGASMNIGNLKCRVCDKVYSDAKKLHYHEENKHIVYKPTKLKKRVSFSDTVIIHEVTDYHKCRKCGKIFHNYRLLKLHKKLKHKKQKCYVCDYCSNKFVDRMSFKVHIKLHCDMCGKLMKNKKKYINHRKKVCRVLKLHKCKKCCGRFFKSIDVKDHNYEHIGSCCVCDICKDRFQSKCEVAQHISFLHCNNRPIFLYTIRNVGSERQYLCSFCDYSSVDRELIEKHVQLLPDFNNRAMVDYKDHYFCDQCLKMFKTESDMLHHKWTHFLKTSDNSQIRSKNALINQRIKKVYNINEKLPVFLQPKVVLERVKVTEETLPKPKKLNVNSGLNNDIVKKLNSTMKRTLISKYQCQICQRYYSNNYSLNRHVESIHSDYEHLQCKVCEEIFVLPFQLKSHKCIRRKAHGKTIDVAEPESTTSIDNLPDITPSFDDLNISESVDYFNSVDFDIQTPSAEHGQYDGPMCDNDSNVQSLPVHKYVSGNVQIQPVKQMTDKASDNVQIPPVKHVTNNASNNAQIPSVNKYVNGNVQIPPAKFVTDNVTDNVQIPSLNKYVSGNVQTRSVKFVTNNSCSNVHVQPVNKYECGSVKTPPYNNYTNGIAQIQPPEVVANNTIPNLQIEPVKYVTNYAGSNVQIPPVKFVTNNSSSNAHILPVNKHESCSVKTIPCNNYFSANVQIQPAKFLPNNALGNVQVPSVKYVTSYAGDHVQIPPEKIVTNNISSSNVHVPPVHKHENGCVKTPTCNNYFSGVANNAIDNEQVPPVKYVTNYAVGNVQTPPVKYVINSASDNVKFPHVNKYMSGNVQISPAKFMTNNNVSDKFQVPPVKYASNNSSGIVQIPPVNKYVNGNTPVPPVNKYVSGNVQIPAVNKYLNGNTPVTPVNNYLSGNVQIPPVKYLTNNIYSNVPPQVNDGKYVPLHSLGYKLVMQEISIEY